MVGLLTATAPTAGAADPEPERIYYVAPEVPGRPATARVAEFTDDTSDYRDLPGARVGPFSPDGAKVAYARTIAGPGRTLREIQVAAPDGTGAVTVSTPDPATEDDSEPQWWSADTVVFTRTSRSGGTAIWAAKADGSDQRLLLDGLRLVAANPKTGDLITSGDNAVSLRPYNAADGTFGPPRPLPPEFATSAYEGIVFSPDGGKVAFTSLGRLFVAAADGSALREVYRNACVNALEFAWAPTGDRLAVQMGRSGTALSVVDLTGQLLRTVWVGEQGVAGSFHWQPSGAVPAPTPPPAAPAPETPPSAFVNEAPNVVPLDGYAGEEACEMVIARSAADNSVWSRIRRPSMFTWTPWTKIGGPARSVTTQPIAEGGQIVVAQAAGDGSLHAMRNGPLPGQWRPWQLIGGPAEDVNLLNYQPIKQPLSVLVLARDPNTHAVNSLQLPADWPNHDGGGWAAFGGPAGSVHVAENPSGGKAVVARTPGDGSVFARVPSTTYPFGLSDWFQIGGPSTEASLSYAAEGPVVTARSPVDGSLWTAVSLTPNTLWQQLGGPAADFVAAQARSGDFAVVARPPDRSALWITPYNHSQNGQWAPQPWFPLPTPPGSSLPGLHTRTDGGTTIATITPDGTPQIRTCTIQWTCGAPEN